MSGSAKAFSRIESEGFFNVSTMNPTGAYLSRTARNDWELRLIERYNTPIDLKYKVRKPATKGRPCFYPALSYYMMYDGRVQVSCTGSFQNAFTDGMPELPREAVACPFDRCLGCTDMYRSIEDEELVTSPLKLYTLEDFASEVRLHRHERRWKNRVRDLPGGLGRLFGAKPTEEALRHLRNSEREPEKLESIPAEATGPALPPQPLFGAVDGSLSVEARSRDRITLSGWAASARQDTPVMRRQNAHNEELIGKLKQRQEHLNKQHAHNEELIGQINQQREQVEELSACIRKQHADNEELIGQLKQRREQVEELSACVRKQHADNEQMISSLQGKDRFVLQLEQRHAVEKRELEKRLQELTQDHTQALELSANLRQELATAGESRQQLALMINRRLSVRLRRSLHKLLDISQARTPEPLRRALRGLYLPVYRLLFPSGKGEFETLDILGAGNVSLRKDKGPPA